jgi:hypothetical protein
MNQLRISYETTEGRSTEFEAVLTSNGVLGYNIV